MIRGRINHITTPPRARCVRIQVRFEKQVKPVDPETYDFPKPEWPITHGGEFRQTIILRHYGAVFDSADEYGEDDDPETVPLTIEMKSLLHCLPTPCYGEVVDWTDFSSLFDVYVPGNRSREVWVSMKLDDGEPVPFSSDFLYRIDLVTEESVTQLRSDKTFAEPEDAPNVCLLYTSDAADE